jgi:rhomboid protease GluP
MITCPHCHASVIAPYDDKCPICRQPLPEMQVSAPVVPMVATPQHQRAVDFLTTLHVNTPRVWAMRLLVAANVLVYIAMVATGASPLGPPVQTMIDWGANFGPRTLDHQQWRMLTSAFLHFGILHLAFNMWVLWQLGELVERLVGNIGFLVLYIVSALGGSVLSLLWNPMVVSAGASGAVFGVGGALMGFIVLRRDTIPAEVLKHLRGSMLSFLAYNLVFGLAVSGVDVACHIGGLLSGFVCGMILSQPLGPEMVRRRWQRNLACIGAALLISPLAIAALPRFPTVELHDISHDEVEIMGRYEAQLKRNSQKKLSDAEWADELDRDVLKPWRQLCVKVNALAESRLVNPEWIKGIADYFALRERSWNTLVVALRTDDKAKVAEFQQLWGQANSMAQKLSQH